MWIRVAAKHPVGDHSVAGWEIDRAAAHFEGVCCFDADSLEEWVEYRWPALQAMGYYQRSLELAIERASEEEQEREGLQALRVWIVEGCVCEEQQDIEGTIIIAESATDITAQALACIADAQDRG